MVGRNRAADATRTRAILLYCKDARAHLLKALPCETQERNGPAATQVRRNALLKMARARWWTVLDDQERFHYLQKARESTCQSDELQPVSSSLAAAEATTLDDGPSSSGAVPSDKGVQASVCADARQCPRVVDQQRSSVCGVDCELAFGRSGVIEAKRRRLRSKGPPLPLNVFPTEPRAVEVTPLAGIVPPGHPCDRVRKQRSSSSLDGTGKQEPSAATAVGTRRPADQLWIAMRAIISEQTLRLQRVLSMDIAETTALQNASLRSVQCTHRQHAMDRWIVCGMARRNDYTSLLAKAAVVIGVAAKLTITVEGRPKAHAKIWRSVAPAALWDQLLALEVSFVNARWHGD